MEEKIDLENLPNHIAIIMDGNRRWAKAKGLPANLGHKEGAKTLEKIVSYANKIGIQYLTVYAFSTENWSRPKEEVDFIMKEVIKICGNYKKFVKENVKVNVIGAKENIPSDVAIAIDEVQFLDKEVVNVCEHFANLGVRVIVAGLDKDFRGEPFGVMPELLARAEYVTKLDAICQVCGAPATRTQRLINGVPARYDDPIILVGAKEQYEARCRHCHVVLGKEK